MSMRALKRTLLACVAVGLPACLDDRPAGDADTDVDAVRQPLTTVADLTFTSHTVKPSRTTPGLTCATGKIGCDGPTPEWGGYAPNTQHVLYLPYARDPYYRNNLLVFLGGANSQPDSDNNDQIYKVAAHQGYFVIGLSYFCGAHNEDNPTAPPGAFSTCGSDLSCFGAAMDEVALGVDCPVCTGLDIDKHPQDALENRLLKVLQWAVYNHPGEGWERFLVKAGPGPYDGDQINWSLITVGGFSNGSSYAAYLGLKHPSIKRVALLNGPNDGHTKKRVWQAADYLQNQPGLTDTRYFGLVHFRNHEDKLYELMATYDALGVKGKTYFDPKPNPNEATDFNGAHMLISIESETPPADGHTSVIKDEFKGCSSVASDPFACTIGYEEAWRYIFGSGKTLRLSDGDPQASGT
jgi:hypothetical protein